MALLIVQARMVLQIAGLWLARGTRLALVRRMAALLGLTGFPGPRPSWWRRIAGLMAMAAFVMMGIVLPGIWVPANAVAMDRATRQLGARAVAYYGPGVLVRHGVPAGLVGAVRVVVGGVVVGEVVVGGVQVGEVVVGGVHVGEVLVGEVLVDGADSGCVLGATGTVAGATGVVVIGLLLCT